jgi:transposase
MSEDQKIRRRAKRVPGELQRAFGFGGEGSRSLVPGEVRPAPLSEFHDGDRRALFIGVMGLKEYLQSRGQGWVVELAEVIDSLDVSSLEHAYSRLGRRAIHPRRMLGLILYGILNRQWSLRELETLAQRDVGAWWIAAGLQPDHSTIGKFIDLHAETLSEAFFESLLKHVVSALGLSLGSAAIDGTVVASAASRLTMLKHEAATARLAEAARAAAATAAENPDDSALREAAQEAAALVQTVAERATKREEKGRPGALLVSPTDPEAVLQPSKKKVMEPSYKPSVIVVPGGVIIGQSVLPSSETLAVEGLLGQHVQALGGVPSTLMMDAGYHVAQLLAALCALDIDVLCPSGNARDEDSMSRKGPNEFSKRDFAYDVEKDCYRCPAGELLTRKWVEEANGRKVAIYETKACRTCPLRSKCTKAKSGRRIKRFEGDEYKDAMEAVLAQPSARAKYRKRQGLVEPVFAELRERQGLRRFRRVGLRKVRAEFALHCAGHNLKRVSLRRLAVRCSRALRETRWAARRDAPRSVHALA